MKQYIITRLAVAMAAVLFNEAAAGAEVKCLGMTLADPSENLLKRYALPAGTAGPVITAIHDPSFFPKGQIPTNGCVFWIVESQARGMMLNTANEQTHPAYQPKSLREFAGAILACTIAPEEFEKLVRQTADAARKQAEATGSQPAQRKRLLEIAEAKVSPEDAGKWICRVVYNYPGNDGTMTTYIRMTKADLEKVRELFKELSRPGVGK